MFSVGSRLTFVFARETEANSRANVFHLFLFYSCDNEAGDNIGSLAAKRDGGDLLLFVFM